MDDLNRFHGCVPELEAAYATCTKVSSIKGLLIHILFELPGAGRLDDAVRVSLDPSG